MKNHAFNQAEVFMLERRVGQIAKNKKWKEFAGVCDTLDVSIRATGGNFLTHEVNCTEDDFCVILELCA